MSVSLAIRKNTDHYRGPTDFNIPVDITWTVARVAIILEWKKGDKNRYFRSAHITPPEVKIEEIDCEDPISIGCMACGKEEEGGCNTCVNNRDLSIDFAVAQVLAEIAVLVPEFKDREDEDLIEPKALLFPKTAIERAALLGNMPRLEVERHEER